MICPFHIAQVIYANALWSRVLPAANIREGFVKCSDNGHLSAPITQDAASMVTSSSTMGLTHGGDIDEFGANAGRLLHWDLIIRQVQEILENIWLQGQHLQVKGGRRCICTR